MKSTEEVLSSLKKIKIFSECYRNRDKSLGLKFNLIAGIYMGEMSKE